MNGLPICADLDHCVVDAKIMPWAREIIIALDSYAEFSPSGTGAHILGDDIKLPGKGRKRPYESGAVEIYDTKVSSRLLRGWDLAQRQPATHLS